MKRDNCWEILKCGREPGGKNADELSVCPAAASGKYNGINRGKFRGRFCWAVVGTFCNGKIQGTFSQKLMDCIHCKFFKQVNDQEGREFTLTPQEAEKRQSKRGQVLVK